ncbi:IQ motif, EF-hand binding site [Corchorus capsularis]|uniref:IQ motif, EF-hand binding site n=1 Tax=Corchorus capsularis TaxID=210143 RepID=A0A1R3I2K8_COCAP|nr:IQ motif, EF-hand binding site [Corchorus capsularis]
MLSFEFPLHYLNQILREGQHRWLRPAEVCEILINHAKFPVLDKPRLMPPARSMFLFDRHALRYFRRDGHNWKKKSDGKTIKEAHEKLKVVSVEVLHCYYAHGEDDEKFQRRCYWMLDEDFHKYVFVHYRQVEEGYKYNRSGCSRLPFNVVNGSLPSLVHENSPAPKVQTYHASTSTTEWNGQTLDYQSTFSPVHPIYGSIPHTASMKHEVAGIHYNMTNSAISMQNQNLYVEQPIAGELIAIIEAGVTLDELLSDVDVQPVAESPENVIQNESKLKKLDSFGRWMEAEMGGDCHDSLIASDHSVNYWNPLDIESDVSEVSSLYPLDPSLVEQLFTIVDFAPNWAYSGVETQVLIIGDFLQKSKELSNATNWCCMFGEIEVPAEVVGKNVVRCQVPSDHSPGHVPFYITCCNRLACSEIKSFEFREKPPGFLFDRNVKTTAEEEMLLKVRLAILLDIGPRRKWSGCSVKECDKCRLTNDIYSMGIACPNDWMQPKDGLIQNLLKERLYEWLLYKFHHVGENLRILDEEGQGVIHLAASLGYNWAIGPIIAAGISINFRDRRGRTGLHWASYFGREGTVITLIQLGANPGAVDDPTSCFPGGRTAADLASSKGHKGIAGFLAENALLAHFASLTVVNRNAIETTATTQVATSNGSLDNKHCSLKMSLAAVRNSAHAAALIQEHFRTRSFRDKQLTKGNDDMSNVSLNRNQKTSDQFGDYLHLHTAAAKIQQKYRGWKGRKEFLNIRNRIVKIQAHVRGHQVRKQYKKLLWSISIIEKLIRWKRKGAALRLQGFRVQESIDTPVKTGDEYEHLKLGRQQKINGVEKALARVQSMARDQEARDQYMRLTTKFGESEVSGEGSNDSTYVDSGQEENNLLFYSLGDQMIPDPN